MKRNFLIWTRNYDLRNRNDDIFKISSKSVELSFVKFDATACLEIWLANSSFRNCDYTYMLEFFTLGLGIFIWHRFILTFDFLI